MNTSSSLAWKAVLLVVVIAVTGVVSYRLGVNKSNEVTLEDVVIPNEISTDLTPLSGVVQSFDGTKLVILDPTNNQTYEFSVSESQPIRVLDEDNNYITADTSALVEGRVVIIGSLDVIPPEAIPAPQN